MRKLLILLAVSTIGVTSCSKNSSENGPYTCYCAYGLITGVNYHDTTSYFTYASDVNLVEARNYCADKQDTLIANPKTNNPTCFIK